MASLLPSGFDSYEFIHFSEDHAPKLQQLLERCGDYYEMVEGRPAGPRAAIEEISDRPAEMAPEDLFCLGIQTGSNLLAVLIAFGNYRLPQQWYITFLLLDPAWRHQKLGRRIYLAFEIWITSQGATSVRLAVVDFNFKAKSFWTSVGFRRHHEYADVRIGLRTHTLIEYEKLLPPGA